jgi:hypothetical protein
MLFVLLRTIPGKSLFHWLMTRKNLLLCFSNVCLRASQDMLDTLFDWAKDGHERTLNQRVRPGLIIVLNKNTAQSHDILGDVNEATQKLLNSFQNSTRFEELCRKWKARGRTVRTAEELILCYYDFFRVLSVPTHTTQPPVAKQIAHQLRTLYEEIEAMSRRIREKRRTFNMDLDVSSFSAYLEHSVNTLARDHRNSIDFHRLSEGDYALPSKFSEHLVQLLSNMVKLRELDTTNIVGGEAGLVVDAIPFIAACIMAQLPRSGTPGEC